MLTCLLCGGHSARAKKPRHLVIKTRFSGAVFALALRALQVECRTSTTDHGLVPRPP